MAKITNITKELANFTIDSGNEKIVIVVDNDDIIDVDHEFPVDAREYFFNDIKRMSEDQYKSFIDVLDTLRSTNFNSL